MRTDSRAVTREFFGTTPDGAAAELFTIVNAAGVTLKATNYGGIIVSLLVPDRAGWLGDLVLGLWNRTQHYRRAYTRVFRSEGDRSVHHEHHLLLSALRRRDVEDAERVLQGHIRRTRLELARHPEVFSA